MVWDWNIIRKIIEILWLIDILLAGWTVFRSHRDIASTWAWLLVLIGIPYIGFLIYLFLGRQISHDDIFAIQNEQKKIQDQYLTKQQEMLKQYDMLPEKEKSERARMLTTLNLNTDSAFITFDNNVKIFTDGTKLFKDIIAKINNAKESINVEFYTFYSDDLGNHVLKALEDAARRGVKVRVIYDASGSLGTKSSYFDNLRKLGGEA